MIMIKIMFVCLGNICRSPMAEFVLKDLAENQGLTDEFLIQSAATSTEEIGNPVHSGTRRKLDSLGISTKGKYAINLTWADYEKYDFFIGMDDWNIKNMKRILKNDPDNKIHKLLDFTSAPKNIEDPWYTHDFETTYKEVLAGCEGFLQFIKNQSYR